MSGHSKWATTHRAKEIKDQARGKLFSKLSRIITIAAKTGGGPNPDSNFRLKDAIEKARAISMPKENIQRAISKAAESGDLFEVAYEGFGPGGVSVIVEAATDNKNRTVAEMKNIFEKHGGSLGSLGSVSYNFDHKGVIEVEKGSDPDMEILQLIDLGAGDIDDNGKTINVYVDPSLTHEMKERIEKAGIKVNSSELIMKPKLYVDVTDLDTAKRLMDLLDALEDHDDTQNVFENSNIADSILSQL